jgi:ABC-type branched-subunit amino acid transport system substrate-binding protein
MAKFVRNKLGVEQIISLTDSTCLYCLDLNEYFVKEFTHLNGKIKPFISYHRFDFDFDKVFQTYHMSTKETPNRVAFFIPNHEDLSARIVKRILLEDKSAIIIGGDGWGDKGELFFRILGKNGFNGYKFTHWVPTINTKRSQFFVEGYVKNYKFEPVESSALIYDAVSIVFEAIKSGKQVNREMIAQFIESTVNYKGVSGVINFSKDAASSKEPLIQKVGLGTFEIF